MKDFRPDRKTMREDETTARTVTQCELLFLLNFVFNYYHCTWLAVLFHLDSSCASTDDGLRT